MVPCELCTILFCSSCHLSHKFTVSSCELRPVPPSRHKSTGLITVNVIMLDDTSPAPLEVSCALHILIILLISSEVKTIFPKWLDLSIPLLLCLVLKVCIQSGRRSLFPQNPAFFLPACQYLIHIRLSQFSP